jgi:hypothetical protein
MRTSVRRGSLVAAVAIATLAGVAAPANAAVGPETAVTAAGGTAEDPTTDPTQEPTDVNTAPPAEPEEPDLGVPEEPEIEPLPNPKDPVVERPDGPYCGPTTRVYTPTSKGGLYHHGIGPTESNYNNTSQTARTTFTAEASGEVGVSVSAGLTASVDVMITKIEAKYGVDLSAKIGVKLGNSIAVNTPPRTRTNGKYGVYRLKNTGVSYIIYSNCTATAKKTVTSYTPLKRGWYLWEG